MVPYLLGDDEIVGFFPYLSLILLNSIDWFLGDVLMGCISHGTFRLVQVSQGEPNS
jgi:hypothetical protein